MGLPGPQLGIDGPQFDLRQDIVGPYQASAGSLFPRPQLGLIWASLDPTLGLLGFMWIEPTWFSAPVGSLQAPFGTALSLHPTLGLLGLLWIEPTWVLCPSWISAGAIWNCLELTSYIRLVRSFVDRIYLGSLPQLDLCRRQLELPWVLSSPRSMRLVVTV